MNITIAQALQLGVTAHKEGKTTKAEKIYRAILRVDKNHPDANHNLGVLEATRGNLKSASHQFEIAIESDPSNEQFWVSYIKVLVSSGQLALARSILERAKNQRIPQQRISLLEADLISASSTNEAYLAQLDDLLGKYKNQQFEAAESLARDIATKFPDEQFAWKVLGAVLIAQGKPKESLEPNLKSIHLAPWDIEAHINLGATHRAHGNLSEAKKCYLQALEINPKSPDAHYNLGVILQDEGQLIKAQERYEKAIEINMSYAEAHGNLGNIQREFGKLRDAVASYKTAIRLKPTLAEIHSNLGITLKELGELEAAKVSLNEAIRLNPLLAEAWSNMGLTLKELGQFEEAKKFLKQALKLKPSNSTVEHMLSAIDGIKTSAAPIDYVERLFDGYARKFDKSLISDLNYNTPKAIAELIIGECKANSLGSVLDLGCGTGLLGAEIKNFCEYIEGVDISQKMLEEAAKKGIYSKLVKQDIINYLSQVDLCFDYFIATDVFVYIGDLSDIFRLIKTRNKGSGKLVFSTEDRDEGDFTLGLSGRYSHSKIYIESLCEKFDFNLRSFRVENIRRDKDQYINGGLYVLDFNCGD